MTYDRTDKIRQISRCITAREYIVICHTTCVRALNNHRHFLAKLRRLLCDRRGAAQRGDRRPDRSKGLSQRQFSLAIRDYCGTSERGSLPRESPPAAAAEERRSEERVGSREGRGDNFRSFSLFLPFRAHINSTPIFILDTEHSRRRDSKNLHKKGTTCCDLMKRCNRN